MEDLGVHVDLHQLAAVPIAHDPLLEHGWTGANGHVALLLRVALLEVGLAGVLLLELVTDCALTRPRPAPQEDELKPTPLVGQTYSKSGSRTLSRPL